MRTLFVIFLLCFVSGCASFRDQATQKKATLDDAIKISSEFYVGMSATKAEALLKKHGIQPSGGGGGNMSFSISYWLSDNSRLSLNVRYLSQKLRDKGPCELIGWTVADPSGKLMPQFSLYLEPPHHQIKNKGTPLPQDSSGQKNPTLDDAIKAIKEFKLGMSDADAEAVLKKYGIQPHSAIGGTMSWKSFYTLSDHSFLVLYYRYLSQELSDKGPSELKGWTLSDRFGEGIPQF